VLPPSPPLRTARETFASSSSSLSNALFRTRFHLGVPLAMKLLMAGGMQQDTIFELVSAPFGSPHLVVVVPPRQFGNPLVTVRTESMLAFPESQQLSFSPEGAFHFHAKALLEIHFPCGVKGVGFSPDFDVPFDGRLCCAKESNGFDPSVSSDHDTGKDPIAPFMGMEVLVLDPSSRLVIVSFPRPLPQHLKDGTIDVLKDFLAHHMLVIARPSPNERIEQQDQVSSRGSMVVFHDRADFFQKCFHVFLRWFDNELAVVLAYILPKKIKAICCGLP
jgi:hypothetical protein